MFITNLYDKTGNNISLAPSWEYDEEDPWMEEKRIYNLGASYKDNDTYRLVLTYQKASCNPARTHVLERSLEDMSRLMRQKQQALWM